MIQAYSTESPELNRSTRSQRIIKMEFHRQNPSNLSITLAIKIEGALFLSVLCWKTLDIPEWIGYVPDSKQHLSEGSQKKCTCICRMPVHEYRYECITTPFFSYTQMSFYLLDLFLTNASHQQIGRPGQRANDKKYVPPIYCCFSTTLRSTITSFKRDWIRISIS